MENFKSGFVSIIGRTNVGKSTLINSLVGEKVAIMANKTQTTRTAIRAIVNRKNSQIVFIDTPGIHKPKHKLGNVMNQTVNDSIKDVDLLIFIVEAEDTQIGKGDMYILQKVIESKIPCILVINKIDKIKRDNLLPIIKQYMDLHNFKAVVPLSALNNDGVNILYEEILKNIPYGPKYYEDDEITNQSEKEIVSEIIREKALKLLDEEIPHGIIVQIDTFKLKEKSDGTKYYNIEATIFCEKDSHKGIIIGKEGTMLKRISTYARQDIEKFMNKKVNLKTWVKVKDKWRDNEKIVKNFFKTDN